MISAAAHDIHTMAFHETERSRILILGYNVNIKMEWPGSMT
jgi:hypothetical protein